MRAEAFERPAAAEVPIFAVHIGQAPLGHPLHDPGAGLVHLGRSGEPRPVAIGQPEQRVHGLRSAQSLVADLSDGGKIEPLRLSARSRQKCRETAQEDGRFAKHAAILPLRAYAAAALSLLANPKPQFGVRPQFPAAARRLGSDPGRTAPPRDWGQTLVLTR